MSVITSGCSNCADSEAHYALETSFDDPRPAAPQGLVLDADLGSKSYRDDAGDLCEERRSRWRCPICGRLFMRVVDIDLDMMGWKTVVTVFALP